MINIEGTAYLEAKELPEFFYVLFLERHMAGDGPSLGGQTGVFYRAVLLDADRTINGADCDTVCMSVVDIAEAETPSLAVDYVLYCGTLIDTSKVYLRRRYGHGYAYWQPDAIGLAEGAEIEMSNIEADRRLANLWFENPDAAHAECILALMGEAA